jgi:hypothetical protein
LTMDPRREVDRQGCEEDAGYNKTSGRCRAIASYQRTGNRPLLELRWGHAVDEYTDPRLMQWSSGLEELSM